MFIVVVETIGEDCHRGVTVERAFAELPAANAFATRYLRDAWESKPELTYVDGRAVVRAHGLEGEEVVVRVEECPVD